ncbi:MAG: hypothetical protein SV108_05635 [Pseudomonadota bacterium]|nr:hypothetical protein [Pseudomonadota bacterium]
MALPRMDADYSRFAHRFPRACQRLLRIGADPEAVSPIGNTPRDRVELLDSIRLCQRAIMRKEPMKKMMLAGALLLAAPLAQAELQPLDDAALATVAGQGYVVLATLGPFDYPVYEVDFLVDTLAASEFPRLVALATAVSDLPALPTARDQFVAAVNAALLPTGLPFSVALSED